MAFTLFEAAKISRNPLASGIMRALATTDELLAVLPMAPTSGDSYRYKREKALPTVEFVAPDHTSIAESSPTFDQVVAPLRLIVSDVDVYMFAEQQQSEIERVTAVNIRQKVKALGRTIGEKLITGVYGNSNSITPAIGGVTLTTVGPNQDSDRVGNGTIRYNNTGTLASYRAPGDPGFGPTVNVGTNGAYLLQSSNPNKWIVITVVAASLPGAATESSVYISSTSEEWDGLQNLVRSARTIASTGANGDALSFEILDRLIDEMVKVRENRVFVMNGKLKKEFYSLMRGLGGTDPMHVAIPGINGQVPTYRGIPILQNDWIPTNESKGGSSTLTSVYLLSLGEGEGFHMRHGGRGGSETADLDPRQVRINGVQIRDVGELESKEARRYRVSYYGVPVLGSELAVARASQIETA